MSRAVTSMVEEVLRPLLRADGGDIELVEATPKRVIVRLHGEAAFGSGAPHVRARVVEPALRKAAGKGVEVVIEKAVPKATRRSQPGADRPD
ncbi:MAG: NifU family protein [Sandaracinus sp.]|nr:NifU family protein [Sandaracinus sp.]MCB9622411.1 NifU family protein [Sandaracinus sp.]